MNKILIVEDDHNLGLMIKDILEFQGYEIELSKKPEETIENLKTKNIDLVLIDKLMSGVDGTDVCREIRNTEGISDIPVLMMSALHEVREECIAAGATDFIYKPFEINVLHEKVRNIIKEEKSL